MAGVITGFVKCKDRNETNVRGRNVKDVMQEKFVAGSQDQLNRAAADSINRRSAKTSDRSRIDSAE
jgi:hypothetical protein